MADVRRLATYTGVVAPLVAWSAIVVATVQSPAFSWTHSPLSMLGARAAPTAPVFNGGLILAGVAALPFFWRLWEATDNRLQRVGTGALGVAAVLMALIGVFSLPHPLHFPVAVPHFLAHIAGMSVYGVGALRTGKMRWGRLSVGLGVAHVLTWTVWGVAFAALNPGPVPGMAIPQSVGALVYGSWVVAMARRIATRRPTTTASAPRTTEQ